MIMLSPTASATPVFNKNHLRIPSRKLWQNNSTTPESNGDNWSRYRNVNNKEQQWDGIQSPQFVDFSNLPEVGDSFFNKLTVIVSTPISDIKKLPNIAPDDNTLIESLDNFSLSDIKCDAPDVTIKHIPNVKDDQKYVVHNATLNLENKVQTQKCDNVKKPHKIAVHPFTFDLREKHRQETKQERIKKILEEEKKMRIFRANPLPKFLKTRTTACNPNNDHNHNNNTNNNNNNDHREKIFGSANEKPQKTNFPNMHTKKNTELWRKPPFVPCPSKKHLETPKTPPLYSTIRAQERKRFDEAVKEKERQKEEMRQMEIAAKKRQEEEEIAQLRKQTVHKAQPVRKYKLGLPQVQKRPLTDPVSPISLKRRRRM